MIWVFIDSLKDRMYEIKHWFRAFVCKDVFYDDSNTGRKCHRLKTKSIYGHLDRNCTWWCCPKNKNLKGGENAGEKEVGEA